jgi:hypothetical protein
MKVKELIDLLMREDPHADIVLEYDSMTCVYDEFVVGRHPVTGTIYLMCECVEDAERYGLVIIHEPAQDPR